MPSVWPIKMLKVDATWDATSNSTSTASTASQPPAAKRPRVRSNPSVKESGSLTSTLSAETTWTVADIAKAGCLLHNPQLEAGFEDEEEMRRVYALIYDVFRYKAVLNKTLQDSAFYLEYPQFSDQQGVIELLLFDLHKRRFLPRSHQSDASKKELFLLADLAEPDAILVSLKTRIAASLARIRIGSQALELNTLLPSHLRDERFLSPEEAFVTGWVNMFRTKDEPRKMIEGAGLRAVRPNQEAMEPFNYQFDPICPKFVLCHPAQRIDLLQSQFVKDNMIVLQDRSFCLGPALMYRVLLEFDLGGKIVQTHINSPRSVAYLASIVADMDKIEDLLAFGAADKKEEYENYLQSLGVTNTRIFAERFVDIPPESDLLEGVVGVLASPPNTYSAVTDPVDLVCSRGGDIEMLRVLTDIGGNSGGEERIRPILEEQRTTLMHAMSKPQIQVVVYETHSLLEAENETMVYLTMEEMNRTARERHADEQGARMSQSQQAHQARQEQQAQEAAAQQAQDAADLALEQGPDAAAETQKSEVTMQVPSFSNSKVPPCDLFEVGKVPNMCLNPNNLMQAEGCYLALLQRKEIVRLDAKYMINIAETRGLFGDQGVVTPSKKSRAQKKRAAMAAARSASRSGVKRQPRATRKIEVERIAAPTQASLMRQHQKGSHDAGTHMHGVVVCKRHQYHNNEGAANISKVVDSRKDSSFTSCEKTVSAAGNRSTKRKDESEETVSAAGNRSNKRKDQSQEAVSATGNRSTNRKDESEDKTSQQVPNPRRLSSPWQQQELVKRLSVPTQASLLRSVGNRRRDGRGVTYIFETDSGYGPEPTCPMCKQRMRCSSHQRTEDTAHPNTPDLNEYPASGYTLLYEEDEHFLLE